MRTVQTNRSIKARNRKENSYKLLLTFKDKRLMKKLLLSLVALVATVSLYADDIQPWQKSFTPVADANDLAGVHVAQASDGSVYVSSTQNAAFTFGSTEVSAAEVTGAVIVKYNKNGEEQWATVISGAATITAMDVLQDNGALYVAGTFTDVISYTDAEGKTQTVESPDVISAFIGKVTPEGGIAAFKQIKPEVDPAIAAAVGDPWDEGFESPLYQAWDPIYVKPNKILVAAGYVVVSAFYMGDVPELGWDGAYINFGTYMDDISAGVFMLDADLSQVMSVGTVQKTGTISDEQAYPEAISFAADNGSAPVIGFVGYGKLTFKNDLFQQEEDFSFTPGAHPFVLVNPFSNGNDKVFEAAPHWKSAKPYNLFMDFTSDHKLIVAGTTYGELPLDNTQTTGEATPGDDAPVYSLNYAPFVASLSWPANAEPTVNWAQVAPMEANAVKIVLVDDEIHAATDKGGFGFDAESGEMLGEMDVLFADVDAYANKYEAAVMVNENSVVVMNIEGEKEEDKEPTQFGNWTKSVKPFAEEDYEKLTGLHTTVGADGSVYASMTYTQAFQFAGNEIPAPEDNMTGAVVLKYDYKGREEWAVTFQGSATVTAMTTDQDGNLYVALSREGDVAWRTVPASGTAGSSTGGDWEEAYLLQIDPDGTVLGTNNIAPEPDEDLLATEMYWPEGLYFTVNKMQCYGNKLYCSASFNANVPNIGWDGAYLDFGSYMENRSKGIFTIDCSNFSDIESLQPVLNIRTTERISSEVQQFAETLNFGLDDKGKLYYSFVGFGKLSVITPTGSQDYSFDSDETAGDEHALVLGNIDDYKNAEVYHADKNTNSYPQYEIKNMIVEPDGCIYMGGTFYGNNWFVPSVTADKNTAFWTRIGINDGYDFSRCSDHPSVISAYTLEGGNPFFSFKSEGTYRMYGSDFEQISEVVLDDADRWGTVANAYVSHDGAKVYISGRCDETAVGIDEVAPAAQLKAKKGVRYNLAGQRVSDSYKGFVIEDGVTKYYK